MASNVILVTHHAPAAQTMSVDAQVANLTVTTNVSVVLQGVQLVLA